MQSGQMKILAFDTSANSCSICLKDGKKILSIYNEELARGQAELLIPQIEIMLKKNSLVMKDIDLIAVCNGAGSFTGLRASISAARAFAIALEKPVLGINSFEAYYKLLSEEEKSDYNVVIVESKREDFYYALYDREGNELKEPQAQYFDDIMSVISDNKISVIGDGADRFIEAGENLDIFYKKNEDYPNVEMIADIAYEKYMDNKEAIDKDIRKYFPSPLYIRAPYTCK